MRSAYPDTWRTDCSSSLYIALPCCARALLLGFKCLSVYTQSDPPLVHMPSPGFHAWCIQRIAVLLELMNYCRLHCGVDPSGPRPWLTWARGFSLFSPVPLTHCVHGGRVHISSGILLGLCCVLQYYIDAPTAAMILCSRLSWLVPALLMAMCSQVRCLHAHNQCLRRAAAPSCHSGV